MGATKKAEATASQVVVMAAKKRFSKRTLLMLAAAVLLLVIAGLVAWLLLRDTDKAPPKAAKAQNSAVLKQSASLEDDRNYSEQAKQLQGYIDSNPPKEYAEKEIIRLAVAYQNAGDFQKAIDNYQIALDKYPDSKLAATRGLGFAYMKRGDKTQNKDDYRKALTYFEQSIKLVSSDSETAHVAGSDEADIRYLKEMLGENQ
jgi:tetratricopeptide (TPR) repeat protein